MGLAASCFFGKEVASNTNVERLGRMSVLCPGTAGKRCSAERIGSEVSLLGVVRDAKRHQPGTSRSQGKCE